jgi:chromosome segregation ATPase
VVVVISCKSPNERRKHAGGLRGAAGAVGGAEPEVQDEDHRGTVGTRQIENELSYERSRANEYEAKFRDAVLQSAYSSEQDILEKLNSKENELNHCRREVIDLNRRLTNAPHSPAQNDLIALAQENEELMANIEEIKNAAISAIMMKEEEIEELAKTIARYELMENELKFQYDKYDSLEREFDLSLREKDEEIKDLNEKINREREAFLGKL